MEKLKDLRKQIDMIDDRLIRLLARRLAVVKKIGMCKRQNGLPPLDRTRWQKVLADRINKGKKLCIEPELVRKIYRAIHREALTVEKSI